MLLTALENTPVDYTAYVDDDFLREHGFQKGGFQGISTELRKTLEQKINFSKTTGGSAANVCHGFANLGMQSVFIGSVGNDENGEFYADELDKAGVTPCIVEKEGPNGVCMAFITPDRERTFAVNMGKSSSLWPWQFDHEDVEMSNFFHTTAYALDSMYWTVKRAMKIAKKNDVKISFDLASVTSIKRHRRRIRHLLENYVDIVFANEEEAVAFTGADNSCLALDRLAAYGRTAVVKFGAKGAMARGILGSAMCHSYKVSKVKNTNGAGDAFAAGFLYGIAKECSIQKAAQIGAYYAARVVEVEPAKLPYRISNIEDLI